MSINSNPEKTRIESEDHFEVDKIIDDKMIDKKRCHRVRWKGFLEKQDT